eukprot:scaffold18303_cov18-Tisochrysis_lutea.AAC.1
MAAPANAARALVAHRLAHAPRVRGGTSAIALAVQRARKNPQLSTMRLVAGASMIPHIDKVRRGDLGTRVTMEKGLSQDV